MKIFCSRCGTEQSSAADVCVSCGATIVRPLGERSDPVRKDPNSKWRNIVFAALCGIYLINPTAGFLEFLPDNLPLVGNLDEATAAAGLLYALSNLGWIPWQRTK